MLTAADFRWDEWWWKTSVDIGESRLAIGPIDLVFAPEGRGEGPLTDEELMLLNTAYSSMTRTIETAVEGILGQYVDLQGQYGYSPEEQAEYMPDVGTVDDLYELLTLLRLNVQCLLVDDPYIGVEFDCRWDPEHGAGVLVQGTRVVEVGGGDTAVLLWIAKRDAETRNVKSTDTDGDPKRKRRRWPFGSG